MRVLCPKCSASFNAKPNARRIKCPSCSFREDAPENGFAQAFASGKARDGFRPERPPPRPASTMPRGALVAGAVVILALAALALWTLKPWEPAVDEDSPAGTTTPPATPSTCASVPNAPLPPGGPVEVDLITPGVWNVCSNTETQYVWVHNNGTAPLSYAFSVTGPNGSALPQGWAVTFENPQGRLAGHGETESAWAATTVTLTIPAGQPAGQVPAELRAAGAVRPFTFHVQEGRGTVSKAGDTVMTHYDLREASGREIQVGDFCAAVGPSTNAVVGYGLGMMGVAQDETVTLRVPPPFAYGYGGRFGDATLVWASTVTAFGCVP